MAGCTAVWAASRRTAGRAMRVFQGVTASHTRPANTARVTNRFGVGRRACRRRHHSPISRAIGSAMNQAISTTNRKMPRTLKKK
jgi:hypothetical protein